MSFVAADGPAPVDPINIVNIAFFPDLDLADFRDLMRTDQSIPDRRAVDILTTAMMDVNRELTSWVTLQQDAGYATLEDVTGVDYGVSTDLMHFYVVAVFNRAKALMVENYRDYDSTKSGHDKADEMDTRVDDFHRVSREAIRRILGTPKMTLELI